MGLESLPSLGASRYGLELIELVVCSAKLSLLK